MVCALRSGQGRVCSLINFYKGIFEDPEETKNKFPRIQKSTGLQVENQKGKKRIGNIQTLEQFEMLVKMGLAKDNRKGKKSD